VRETERLVQRIQKGRPAKKTGKSAGADADIRRLEIEVSEKLGAKVRLDHTKKGGGKLVISYNSLDELDGILKHIR
jgi:ParB family chromosome partitioning protein